jgi:hypothetical protein
MCSIASASCSANECILIKRGTLLDSGASGPSARLIGAKKGGDEQMTETLGKVDIAQLGDGFGNPIRQSEHWISDRFEDAEASFHGAFAERVAFALGSVFGAELGESFAGQLGHVRCSLIGDGLQAFTASDGRGQHIDNVVGAFVVIDEN